MKKMNYTPVFLLMALVLNLSCTAPKVVYDYDKEADFNAYKTFDFYPYLRLDLNQLDSTRVIQQIESVLLTKGFKKSSTPNIFINIISEQFETPSNNRIGIGLGTGGRNVGVGVSGGIPIRSNTFTQFFKIDLIDAAEDILVWQGTYEDKFKMNISPEDKNEFLKISFEKILSGYPPNGKEN